MMKNLLTIFFFFAGIACGFSQGVIRHGYGVDTTNINGQDQYRLIDTSLYNVFRGGQQRFSVAYEPVDSIEQITNFFEQRIESDFKEGISGIDRVINLNSAIQTFIEFNPTYTLLTGSSMTRYFGLKYGTAFEGSYSLQLLSGSPVAYTINHINGLGNYRFTRTSDNAQFVLVPLPLDCFWINNFDIGNGVTEAYFFKKYGNSFVPFESFFNKYANVVLTPN